MIVYLATEPYLNTFKRLLKDWVPELRSHVRLMSYRELFSGTKIPRATYIFSDFERLTRDQIEFASQRWESVKQQCPVWNDPSRIRCRVDLLTDLYRRGVNDFRIFHLDEIPSDLRYPVFIRREDDHKGARTCVIQSQKELEVAVVEALAAGMDRQKLLVTEHLDNQRPSGLYRKFGAFRVGNTIVPRHVIYDRQWVVKYARVFTPEIRAEEDSYLKTNPHHAELMKIFELAGIEYGRIDYDVIDGRIQVWEINTNPTVLGHKKGMPLSRRVPNRFFAKRYVEALMALDSQGVGELELPPLTLEPRRPSRRVASLLGA